MSDDDENRLAVKHYHRRKTDAHLHSGEEHGSHSDQHDTPEDPDAKKDDGDDSDKDDKNGKGDDEHKKMSPKKKRLLIIIAIIVGIIIIVSGLLYWLHARHYETTDDAFIDGHVSQVSARISGEIITLLVSDNEHVDAGELLAEIDPRDYQVRLAQAHASAAQAEAQIALQKANISQAEANVTAAEAAAFQTERDLKRYRSVNPDAVTHQQIDSAIANAQTAEAKLKSSEDAVKAATAQEQAAEASAEQANVDIQNAELQLTYTKIIAPIEGRITRRTVEVGNNVTPGMPLLAVASNDLWVTANYKETQLTDMRIGQPVRIEIDAFPSAVFSGHIDSFQKGTGSVFSTLPAENATGNYVKVVQRIPVKIVFDNPDERDKYPLSPGMSVDPRAAVR